MTTKKESFRRKLIIESLNELSSTEINNKRFMLWEGLINPSEPENGIPQGIYAPVFKDISKNQGIETIIEISDNWEGLGCYENHRKSSIRFTVYGSISIKGNYCKELEIFCKQVINIYMEKIKNHGKKPVTNHLQNDIEYFDIEYFEYDYAPLGDSFFRDLVA